jgi:hypothetical protein
VTRYGLANISMKLEPLKDCESLTARIPWFMASFIKFAHRDENITLALFRSICEISTRTALAVVALLFSMFILELSPVLRIIDSNYAYKARLVDPQAMYCAGTVGFDSSLYVFSLMSPKSPRHEQFHISS